MQAPNPADADARLKALEERLTFQQRLLDELHQALVAQQGDVARLERQLGHCRAALERLADGQGEDLPHEKPPHY
jgi:SlyX protein